VTTAPPSPVPSPVPLGSHQGTVDSFDDPRGIGTVRSTAGDLYPFHCTSVADGSRAIAAGTVVSFRVVPGRLGWWEATELRPLPG
jgi:cold shock CspA family protein